MIKWQEEEEEERKGEEGEGQEAKEEVGKQSISSVVPVRRGSRVRTQPTILLPSKQRAKKLKKSCTRCT